MTLYPWLEAPLRQLLTPGHHLPHGILLTGPKGVGKLSLAHEISRSLLCEQPEDGLGCNKCHGCRLFEAGTHPDYHLLTTQQLVETGDSKLIAPGERYVSELRRRANTQSKPKQIIGVEQARALIEELRSTSHFDMGKIIVIYPADKLNLNAANALLKVLEEPTANTHFLLLTGSIYSLPPTVRSRCSHYRISTPTQAEALAWLQSELPIGTDELQELLEFSGGSPLQALELYKEESWVACSTLWTDVDAMCSGKVMPTVISNKWNQTGARTTLGWLQRELLRAFRTSAGVDGSENSTWLYNHLGRDKCLVLYQQLGEFLRWPVNAVDEALFLESIVVKLVYPSISGK